MSARRGDIKLTDEQRGVVDMLDGDVFVAAGAGSGKTGVLASRFVDRVLLESAAGSADPLSRTLLITFTDKAAGELVERARSVFIQRGEHELAREVDRAWVSTIHALCSRLLRRHALEAGFDPAFRILDPTETSVLRYEAFDAALSRCDAAAGLVEEYGAVETRQTVISALEKVRAMAADARELVVPEPEPLADAVRACIAVLEEARRDTAALPATATIEGNIAALTEAILALEAVGGDRPGDADVVLRVTDECKLVARGCEEAKAACGEAKAALQALRASASEHVSAGYACVFKQLLLAYDEEFGRLKREAGGLDFEDLKSEATRVLREDPAIAERYAKQFTSVMVDEFQDTDPGQMDVIGPLAAGKLCVVGDERQSIYGFRYADVEIFRGTKADLSARHPEAYHELSVNFRTVGDVLGVVNDIFSAPAMFGDGFMKLAPGRTAAPGTSWPADAPRAEILAVDRAGWTGIGWREAEAAVLARRIGGLVRSGTVRPGQVVVLLRALTDANVYIRALEAQGLEVYAEAAGGFFDTPEVGAMRALLDVLADPADEVSALILLGGVLGGLTDESLLRLTTARSRGGPLGAAGDPEAAGLEGAEAERALLIHTTLARLGRDQATRPLAEVLLEAAEVLAPAGGCLSDERAWANLRKVVRLAEDHETVAPPDAGGFARFLDERESSATRERSAGISAEDVDAVRVMTVHAAKGLEFPVVAVADLGRDLSRSPGRIFVTRAGDRPVLAARPPASWGKVPNPPSYDALASAEKDASDAEGRRILYVACTRAEEALLVSGATALDKEPGASLPIDWIRSALDPDGTGLPARADLRVESVRSDEEEEIAALLSAAPRPVAGRGARSAGSARAEHARATVAAPRTLSYSALGTYGTCPLRFYASSVLGMARPSSDAAGAGPMEYGSAVHAALEARARGALDAARAEAIASRWRLDAAGVERLHDAIAAYEGSGVAQRLAGTRLEAEVPIAVSLENGLVTGTIDLLARDGDHATIVDYKTGSSRLSAAESADRYRGQAEAYALALLREGVARVDVVFVELERGARETSYSFSTGDETALASRLDALLDQIGSGRFDRRESYDASSCSGCPAWPALCDVRRP